MEEKENWRKGDRRGREGKGVEDRGGEERKKKTMGTRR